MFEAIDSEGKLIGAARLPYNDAHLCGRPVCLSLLQGGLSVGEMEVSVTLLQGRPKASF
jgi:hypothetical protein